MDTERAFSQTKGAQLRAAQTEGVVGMRPAKTFRLVLLFLAPAVALYSIFMVLPVGQAALFSTFNWNGFGTPSDFVGLANYLAVLRDRLFWQAFFNNLFLIAFMFVTIVPIALGLALTLAERIPFAVSFRLVFFLPFILADLTAGLIWRYLLDGDYGVFSEVAFLGLDEAYILANPSLALLAVAIVMVWKSFGFHLILFIAGLQQIDRSLYEAAEIDGANQWKKIRHVTIPLLAPTIALSGFFIVISSLQAFDIIMAMTTGGPSRATSTMVHYLYADGISSFRVGFGSAIGVVIFLITLAFALSYRRLTRAYN